MSVQILFKRLTLAVFIFVSITLVACGGGGGSGEDDVSAAGSDNDPIKISGLNTGLFIGDQSPDDGSVINESQIAERLDVIKNHTNCIRVSGLGFGLIEAPRIAQEKGLCVVASAKIRGHLLLDQIELGGLITTALAGYSDYLVVGNDVFLPGGLTKDQLIQYIEAVKNQVPGVMVTTAATYDIWINNPDLVAAVDMILVNYYPYWEGLPVDQAVAAVHSNHQRVVNIAGGKEVVVSETGWPSCGQTLLDAIPSPTNAAFYFENFVSWAEANNVGYFYSSAFDESWRTTREGPQGACWGLWDKDGILKPGMKDVFDGSRMDNNWG